MVSAVGVEYRRKNWSLSYNYVIKFIKFWIEPSNWAD